MNFKKAGPLQANVVLAVGNCGLYLGKVNIWRFWII